MADDLYKKLIDQRESFWTVVYPLYMQREITRSNVRDVVRKGLQEARGNYKIVARLFNMESRDYKRFLNFLRKHDCQVPFKEYPMRGGAEAMRSKRPIVRVRCCDRRARRHRGLGGRVRICAEPRQAGAGGAPQAKHWCAGRPRRVDPPPGYVIGPEDVLAVVFWREKELSVDDAAVRPDGMITVPLAQRYPRGRAHTRISCGSGFRPPRASSWKTRP